jgi:hypothetical protein
MVVSSANYLSEEGNRGTGGKDDCLARSACVMRVRKPQEGKKDLNPTISVTLEASSIRPIFPSDLYIGDCQAMSLKTVMAIV